MVCNRLAVLLIICSFILIGCDQEASSPSTRTLAGQSVLVTVDGPRANDLEFIPHEIEYGQITGGARVYRTVTLTNRRKSEVTVLSAASDCSCIATTTTIFPITISPGSSASIDVLSRPSRSQSGAESKSLRLAVVGNGTSETFVLPISLTVLPPAYTLIPDALVVPAGSEFVTLTVVCGPSLARGLPSELRWDKGIGHIPVVDDDGEGLVTVGIKVNVVGIPKGIHQMPFGDGVVNISR